MRLGERLRRYWLPLVVVTLLLPIGIALAAPNYSDAQYATDADAFRAAVPADDVDAYRLGAVIDIAFAVAYALVALVVLVVVRSWRGWTGRVAAVGCWLVVVGAGLDLVENVLVLVNLGNLESLEDSAVDLMASVGSAKWAAVVAGLALVLVARVAQWLRPAAPANVTS